MGLSTVFVWPRAADPTSGAVLFSSQDDPIFCDLTGEALVRDGVWTGYTSSNSGIVYAVEDAAFVELPGADAVGVPLDRLAHLVLMRSESDPAPAAGDDTALSNDQKAGAQLFYGAARCSECHSGPLLTDFQHHALAVPQLGPGKAGEPDDRGLALESGNTADNYKFRTPALRNVALTAPYFHSGAYETLEDVIRHHLNPGGSLLSYNAAKLPTSTFQNVLDAQRSLLDAEDQLAVSRATVSLAIIDLCLALGGSWDPDEDVLAADADPAVPQPATDAP